MLVCLCTHTRIATYTTTYTPTYTHPCPHRKEALWPYVREFADRAIAHIDTMLQQLRNNMTPCELYAVHGHYADAGEAAALIASAMDADMLMTGHSLGRNKLEHLRASGVSWVWGVGRPWVCAVHTCASSEAPIWCALSHHPPAKTHTL